MCWSTGMPRKRARRSFSRIASSVRPNGERSRNAIAAADTPKTKIGIIGSGRIGGTLGELWIKAGYDVMFSSLDIEHDRQLAAKVGGKAGTPAQAADFGEVLLVSVPYPALAQIGRDYAAAIKGKVVLDTSNPIQARDGDMAVAAREKGTGVASAELLPGDPMSGRLLLGGSLGLSPRLSGGLGLGSRLRLFGGKLLSLRLCRQSLLLGLLLGDPLGGRLVDGDTGVPGLTG